MKKRLTKRVVDDLPVDGSVSICWDEDVSGFGVRHQGRTWRFVYKARTADQRQRWFALGRYGKVTVEEARRAAEDLREQFELERLGKIDDPGVLRDKEAKIPTLKEFSVQYLEYAAPRKKESTLAADRRNLNQRILPKLGQIKVNRITRQDVALYHHGRRKTPISANRCLALLSHMMNLAEAWGLRRQDTNPCTHVERYPETKRERFLSQAELATLGASLEVIEKKDRLSPYGLAAIRLLIFTGARASEILGLRHDQINAKAATAALADSKSGPKTLYLNPPALSVLAGLERMRGNDHVIVGGLPGRHLTLHGLEQIWQVVRDHAKLKDVRLHDLRHSFASVAVSGGSSLPLLGRLLGHSQPSTTQRYSHFETDPLRAASTKIAEHIESAMRGKAKRRAKR